MSKEILESGDDVRFALAYLAKRLRKELGEEKARVLFRDVAAKRWEYAKKSAEERWKQLGGRPGFEGSLEEIAAFATKSHGAAYGPGVFDWKVEGDKIVATATTDYCRFKDFVVGEPILCEFCFHLWSNVGSGKRYQKVTSWSVKQTRAQGADKCIVWFEPTKLKR